MADEIPEPTNPCANAGNSAPTILTGMKPGQSFDEFKENVVAALRARGFFKASDAARSERGG